MADTTTPNIKITNQEAGGNNNTWGDIADANFERIDDVFGDTTSVTTTGGSTTLTDTQELVAIIEVDGALVADADLVFSGRGGFWIVKNGTSGAARLTCKVSGQPGVEIDQGDTKLIYCNGTDIALGNPAEPVSAEETVASAATTDVLGTVSEFVAVSGTAAITSLGTGTNRKRFVRATGAFTLTHDATSLILPGGKDIVAAAGDTFLVISDASSNARVYNYQKASGRAVVSSIPIGFTGEWHSNTLPSGEWVWANGETVGNASSGATQRASDSADTASLFAHLWNGVANTELPIQDSAGTPTTRGASAAADFSANKRMPTPDHRGRVTLGKDNMGGASTAGRITSGGCGITGTTLGATGGEEIHLLITAEMPAHTHTASVTDPGHHHTEKGGLAAGGGIQSGSGLSLANTTSGNATTGITVSNASTGGGGSHNNVQPSIVVNKIIYAGVA